MISDSEIVRFLDDYLRVEDIEDYGMNGIQVDASSPIEKIAFAVDCRMDVITKAVQEDADLIVFHHGLIWEGLKRITESYYDMIKMLMDNECGLYMAHLPLDIHPEVGNNVELARMIDADVKGTFFEENGTEIAISAELDGEREVGSIADRLSERLDTKTIALQKNVMVKNVGILTGKGGDALGEAKERGLDLFITGEREHRVYTKAVNIGMPLILAGHYATETLGIKALMEKIRQNYEYECMYISSKTPL